MWVVSVDSVNALDAKLVGGKAVSLAKMTQLQLPVPQAFVITTLGYGCRGESTQLEQLTLEVMSAFDSLGVDRVAVRSSAASEDARSASWAGVFETYLNITREELMDHVIRCWDSLETARSKSYGEIDTAIAVIVQAMVPSDISGVLFTAHPITNSPNEIVIESIFGLGELIVQGLITPDNYVLHKSSGRLLSQEIVYKPEMLVFENENVRTPLPPHIGSASSLRDHHLRDLHQLALKTESVYGYPLDIEWAFADDKLYLLQARPITTV